jgi:hypothetical protein
MSNRRAPMTDKQQLIQTTGAQSSPSGRGRQGGDPNRRTLQLIAGLILAIATAATYVGCNGQVGIKFDGSWGSTKAPK